MGSQGRWPYFKGTADYLWFPLNTLKADRLDWEAQLMSVAEQLDMGKMQTTFRALTP